MIVRKEHPLIILKERYPQILLPVKSDMSKSEVYKRIVHLGQPIPIELVDNDFSFSDKDFILEETFRCGAVTVLFLFERKDFEKVIQKIAYKCEPKYIPSSMGAITVNGLINWVKIKNGLQDNFGKGTEKEYPVWEYARFLSNKENYQDSLIILSNGSYSGLVYKDSGYDAIRWIQISYIIRKYHELTHFICRKKYMIFKDILMDELFADCMGIMFALGYYDEELAKRFLGIEEKEYKTGMRLENYIQDKEEIIPMAEKALKLIEHLKEITKEITIQKDEFENYIDFIYPKLFYYYSESLF